MFTNIQWGDVVERAAWTALQAFLSAFAGSEALTNLDSLRSTLLAGAVAAGAALISLAKNIVKQHLEGTSG